MPCPTCGAPDQTDLSAEKHGLMLRSEAAKISGRSPTWINARINAGDLETAEFAKRRYVVVRSLERLLHVAGGPSSQSAMLDNLMERDPVGAQELHRSMYPHAYGPHMPSANTAQTAADLPDPWDNFITRNSGGK
jgi:hypothetical protein